MSQDSNPSKEDPVPGANGVPLSDEDAGGQIGEQVTEDVGGVQGSPPDDDGDDDALQASTGMTTTGSPADQPAPGAGEIEWAGQVVKKPPTPQA